MTTLQLNNIVKQNNILWYYMVKKEKNKFLIQSYILEKEIYGGKI